MHGARGTNRYHQTSRIDRRSLKQAFYEVGVERKLAPTTIYRYWRWVRRLILYRQPALHPAHLNDDAVLKFIAWLGQSRLGITSRRQALDAISFLHRDVLVRRESLLGKLALIREHTNAHPAWRKFLNAAVQTVKRHLRSLRFR